MADRCGDESAEALQDNLFRPESDAPDPRRVLTRQDFAAELRLARERSNLSVRELARKAGIPSGTLSGYLVGRHLPALQPSGLLRAILAALGQESAAPHWEAALRRARRSQDRSAAVVHAATYPALLQAVSTHAPVDRLQAQPTLRGRDELVARLASTVLDADARTCRVHVLCGLGGSGKSSIALKVAESCMAQQISVFWLDATDSERVTAGMYALAARIGVDLSRSVHGSLPDAIWRRLTRLPDRWLLVLDNADRPSESLTLPNMRLVDGTGWLRPVRSGSGAVLVTTRDGDATTWGGGSPDWMTLHRLDGLHRDHGSLVLTELAGDAAGTGEEAAELADRLGGHPMALMLAGRFLAEARSMPEPGFGSEPRTYREYLDSLRRGGSTELLTANPDGRPAAVTDVTIMRSCEFSLDLLSSRGLVHARPLLHLLACLDGTAIPHGDLLRTDILSDSALFPGLTARLLQQTLHALEGLGLVSRIEADADRPEMLELHPLARDIARLAAREGGRLETYLSVIATLLHAAVRDADVENPRVWGRWRGLAGHCTAPLELVELQPTTLPVVRSVVETAGRAAAYLRASGQHARAEAAFTAALRGCEGRIHHDDPIRLGIEHDLARLFYDRGRYDDAERLYRRVVVARRRVLGPAHSDTLTTQHYLARTLRNLNRLDEAEHLAESTYAARTHLFGEHNPDTLTARHGLADLHRIRGDFATAAALYAEIITVRGRVLGREHPAVLTSRQYRAETLYELGDVDEAETEMRALWTTNQRVRGLDHPRTIAGGHALVDLLRDRGATKEAASLAEVVLAAGRRVFGHAHPATLSILHSDSLIRLDLGDVSGALSRLEAVLRDRESVLGPRHPQTREAREAVEAIRRRTDLSPSF
ncbi:tetratricopeptide repeat protein [Nocardia farcinica]|uniref:tetratricopeptide repeat protein n=1 Tax=Nocardia farcinica TaxID=37329 RepID=UPI0024568AB0|nr:tetratricopeptide repeat protein [Nocardia farcinica]